MQCTVQVVVHSMCEEKCVGVKEMCEKKLKQREKEKKNGNNEKTMEAIEKVTFVYLRLKPANVRLVYGLCSLFLKTKSVR